MDEAAAARDVALQLAAATAGTPLPRPRRTRDGRVVLPAPEAASGWSVRVYEWADLADGRTVTGAEIGAVAARLHRVRHPAPRAGGGLVHRADRAARLGGHAERRTPGPGLVAGALDRWLPQLIALDTAVAPPDPAVMTTCRRDLNLGALRYAAGGGVVVPGLGELRPASRSRELAAIVADIALDVTLPAGAGTCMCLPGRRAAAGPRSHGRGLRHGHHDRATCSSSTAGARSTRTTHRRTGRAPAGGSIT